MRHPCGNQQLCRVPRQHIGHNHHVPDLLCLREGGVRLAASATHRISKAVALIRKTTDARCTAIRPRPSAAPLTTELTAPDAFLNAPLDLSPAAHLLTGHPRRSDLREADVGDQPAAL